MWVAGVLEDMQPMHFAWSVGTPNNMLCCIKYLIIKHGVERMRESMLAEPL